MEAYMLRKTSIVCIKILVVPLVWTMLGMFLLMVIPVVVCKNFKRVLFLILYERCG